MSENDTPVDDNPSNGGDPAPPVPLPEVPVESEFSISSLRINDGTNGDEVENFEDSDDEDEDDDENFVEMLPKPIKLRVAKMKDLNKARAKLIDEYLSERAALEQKYLKLYKPLYKYRAEIVNGKHDEAIAATAEVESKTGVGEAENDDDEEEEEEDNLVGVPEFWSVAIANIETVSELITESDNECLYFVEDITCDDFEDGRGFTLYFHFKEGNPYFTNKVLTKRYEVPNLLLDDEPILKNVTGCDIDWKPSMCLTHKEVTRKQRSKSGRRAGQIRTIKKKEKCDSFFHFFNPPKVPQKNVEEIDEEEADAIEEAFDHDYDVAQSFRSHIIPKAALWFTGEAMQDEIENMIGSLGELGGQMGNQANTSTSSSSTFPVPVNSSEEPECKQS